jgi:hypothetical protein
MVSPRDLDSKVPENLSSLVMECIRNNPAKRPESMTEVTRRLVLIRHTMTRPTLAPVHAMAAMAGK